MGMVADDDPRLTDADIDVIRAMSEQEREAFQKQLAADMDVAIVKAFYGHQY